RVLAAEVQAAVLDGLDRRHQGELGEAVQPARLLDVEQPLRGEVLDLAGEVDLERRRVEQLDRADAALPLEQALPQDRHADAQRGDRAQARDDYASGHFFACSRSM